jgi:malonyl-CoA O-methyltransferase
MIDKEKVALRFNRSVMTYDRHASVQQAMAHRLVKWLARWKRPVWRVLEIGCGTGYLTELLLNRFPQAQIVAIDLAERMIEQARRRVKSSAVSFVVGDAEKLEGMKGDPYDLIVSNATIQWLSAPDMAMRNWLGLAAEGGGLFVTTFGVDTFKELKQTFEWVERDWGLPLARHGLTMRSAQEWENLMNRAGWRGVDWQECRYKETYSDCRQFLYAVKATGASYSDAPYDLRTERRLLTQVIRTYDQTYREGSGVYATYHAIWLMGRKP